eukprot:98143-Rhodomonas_salina.1
MTAGSCCDGAGTAGDVPADGHHERARRGQTSLCGASALTQNEPDTLVSLSIGASAVFPFCRSPFCLTHPPHFSSRAVRRQYFSDTHFIFIGSFFLADGLQRVNLHRRSSSSLNPKP